MSNLIFDQQNHYVTKRKEKTPRNILKIVTRLVSNFPLEITSHYLIAPDARLTQVLY